MLRQILVGSAVSVCTIAIHALIMSVVVNVAHRVGKKSRIHHSLLVVGVMIPTVSVLMIAHILEVGVWALAYEVLDVAPAGVGLVYFAFVNYTTLGYGDIIPAERWQLLGPITAMNGVLLFGWSTAVIFAILREAMDHIASLPKT